MDSAKWMNDHVTWGKTSHGLFGIRAINWWKIQEFVNLNNSSGPQREESPKDILSNYDNKLSWRSEKVGIEEVRGGK